MTQVSLVPKDQRWCWLRMYDGYTDQHIWVQHVVTRDLPDGFTAIREEDVPVATKERMENRNGHFVLPDDLMRRLPMTETPLGT